MKFVKYVFIWHTPYMTEVISFDFIQSNAVLIKSSFFEKIILKVSGKSSFERKNSYGREDEFGFWGIIRFLAKISLNFFFRKANLKFIWSFFNCSKSEFWVWARKFILFS